MITLGLAAATNGRPAGRTAVGPAVRVTASRQLQSEVQVVLPFSGHLIEFFRGQAARVEVWRQPDGQGWNRVGMENELGDGRVEAATHELSTLQVWFEYPEHLVLDSIAGGGEQPVGPGSHALARQVALQSPASVEELAGEVLLLTEYWGTRIDRLSKTTGLLTNIKTAKPVSEHGETHYTAVMGALQPYCGQSWMCIYYAVEERIEAPYSPSIYATGVQIVRTDLQGGQAEVIAGRLGGDDGEAVPALDAALGRVFGLELDQNGDLLILETGPALSSLPGGDIEAGGNRVRRIDRDTGLFHTIAGTGVAGYNADRGPALQVQLDLPLASHLELMRLHDSLLFIADWLNHRVRAVNVSEQPVVLGDLSDAPVTIAPGEMVTVVGLLGEPVEGSCDQLADGALGTDTRLIRPTGLAVGGGYLFVADECHRVLMMSLDDLRVTAVAGIPGEPGFSGDGLTGIDSRLNLPQGLHFDQGRKELVIADYHNDRLRRLHYRWRIFIRPDGCDTQSDVECRDHGGTYLRPVRSIADALARILREKGGPEPPPPDDDIEVVFAPAVANTYFGQPVKWTYTMPEHSITFKPLDPDNQPTFEGCNPMDDCFDRSYEEHCRNCEDQPGDPGCPCSPVEREENLSRCHCAGGDRRRAGVWFEHRSTGQGQRSNLVFENLRVEGYQDGIGLRGNFDDALRWTGGNAIVNCTFKDLGDGQIDDFEDPDRENRGKPRYGRAGVTLANSRDNVVIGNLFDNLPNDYNIYEGGDTEQYMHGVYLLWYSHNNLIADNVFKRVSGNPTNIRDFSNSNEVSSNLFSKSDRLAAFSEWYCNFEVEEPGHCTKTPPAENRECPSYLNLFHDNILDGRFSHDPQVCRILDPVYLHAMPGDDYLRACCDSPNNSPDNPPNNPWTQLPCEAAGQWSRVFEAGTITTPDPCTCLGDEVRSVDDCRLLLGL